MPKHIFTINPQSIQKEKKKINLQNTVINLFFNIKLIMKVITLLLLSRNIINTLERRLQLSYLIVLWTVFGLQYISIHIINHLTKFFISILFFFDNSKKIIALFRVNQTRRLWRRWIILVIDQTKINIVVFNSWK